MMGMQILHGPLDRSAMQDLQTAISHCRHCRFYQPEGRRGGQCQQLNVTVHGSWQACPLVASPFEVTAGEQTEVSVVEVTTSAAADSAVAVARA